MDRIFQGTRKCKEEERRKQLEEDLGEEEHVGEVSRIEFDRTMTKMKYGKPPRIDGLAIELIKEGRRLGKQNILEHFNHVQREETLPEMWGKTLIVPIYF